MKNKYYYPEISEFHVGFECELTVDNKNWKGLKFEAWDFSGLEIELLNNMYRVKYLDEKDILNLGFRKRKDNFYFHDKYNLMMNHSTEDGIVGLATSDPSKNTLFATTGQDPNKIPRLKIKNKSELKKILEQLD